MKIGIICHPSIGGSGLVATQLGIGLAKKGHEIHFVSEAMPFKLHGNEENIYFHPVEAISYPLFNYSLYAFALTAKIIEVAEKYKLDIVHAHYSIPHSLCAHLAAEISTSRFKIITTIHGTDTTVVGLDKPLYPLNRYSIERSDVVTTVSEYQKKHTLEQFQLNKAIEVIYNFIDPQVFNPQLASSEVRQTLASDDEKIIMHVSNFRQPKNTFGVIKTFAKVVGTINARLVLVGDGPDMPEIKTLCQSLGIIDKVNFLGKRKHLESIIPNADCILQPSYHDSFGMVSLEAMASGVPTVTSDREGVPEVVEHGVTGYTADPDDHETLAAYLVDICSNSELQTRMGENGRARAMEKFLWDRQVEIYLKCYENCLNNTESDLPLSA